MCNRAARPARRGAVKTSAVFGFFRGDAGEQTRKKYQAKVDAINRLEPEMQQLSDQELADKTQDLKSKAQRNKSVDDLLVEAFAVSCSRLYAVDTYITQHTFNATQQRYSQAVPRHAVEARFVCVDHHTLLCQHGCTLCTASIARLELLCRWCVKPPSVCLVCGPLMSSSSVE